MSGAALVVGAGPDEPEGWAEPPAPLTGHDSARAPRLHPEVDVRPVRAPKIGGRCERPGGARGDGGGRGVGGDEAGGFAPPLPFSRRRRQAQRQRCRRRCKRQRRPDPPGASLWPLLLPHFRVPVPEPLPRPFPGSIPATPPPLTRHHGCRASDVGAAPHAASRAPPGGREDHAQARTSQGPRGDSGTAGSPRPALPHSPRSSRTVCSVFMSVDLSGDTERTPREPADFPRTTLEPQLCICSVPQDPQGNFILHTQPLQESLAPPVSPQKFLLDPAHKQLIPVKIPGSHHRDARPPYPNFPPTDRATPWCFQVYSSSAVGAVPYTRQPWHTPAAGTVQPQGQPLLLAARERGLGTGWEIGLRSQREGPWDWAQPLQRVQARERVHGRFQGVGAFI